MNSYSGSSLKMSSSDSTLKIYYYLIAFQSFTDTTFTTSYLILNKYKFSSSSLDGAYKI